MLLAGLLGSLPYAASADAPAHTAILCQTLHQTAQPALAGLMQNDNLLESATHAAAKVSVDRAAGATHSEDADRQVLREAADALSHSLSVISQKLSAGFPQDPDAAARASEQRLKSSLEAVTSAQNDALNLIEGYVATDEVSHENDDFYRGRQIASAPVQDNPLTPAPPFATLATGTQPQNPSAYLQSARSRISNLEEPAGSAILAAEQVCSSSHPQATI